MITDHRHILDVNVELADQTSHELEAAAYELRTVLKEAPLEFLQPTFIPPPVASKSGEAITLGAVTVALTSAAVPRLISALTEWVNRRETRKLELRLANGTVLKMTGPISTSDVEKLISQLAKALSAIRTSS